MVTNSVRDTELYYSTDEVSFADRESFNSTVLLLTMIKRKYYYMKGFSRPDGLIEVGFDAETATRRAFSKSLILDFNSDNEYIRVKCSIDKVFLPEERICGIIPSVGQGIFKCDGEHIEYEYKILKDQLIPVSVQKMNEHILTAKNEIIRFMQCESLA